MRDAAVSPRIVAPAGIEVGALRRDRRQDSLPESRACSSQVAAGRSRVAAIFAGDMPAAIQPQQQLRRSGAFQVPPARARPPGGGGCGVMEGFAGP